MFKKMALFGLVVFVLWFYFIWEHGYIWALTSFAPFIAILLATYFSLSAKHGFKRAFQGICCGLGDPGFLRDALLITNFVGGTLFILGVVITSGRLTQGVELVVYSASQAFLSLLYSFLFSLYLVVVAK